MNRLIHTTLLMLSVPALASSGAPSGPIIYKANCAACHGVKGQGGCGDDPDAAAWLNHAHLLPRQQEG